LGTSNFTKKAFGICFTLIGLADALHVKSLFYECFYDENPKKILSNLPWAQVPPNGYKNSKPFVRLIPKALDLDTR